MDEKKMYNQHEHLYQIWFFKYQVQYTLNFRETLTNEYNKVELKKKKKKKKKTLNKFLWRIQFWKI